MYRNNKKVNSMKKENEKKWVTKINCTNCKKGTTIVALEFLFNIDKYDKFHCIKCKKLGESCY